MSISSITAFDKPITDIINIACHIFLMYRRHINWCLCLRRKIYPQKCNPFPQFSNKRDAVLHSYCIVSNRMFFAIVNHLYGWSNSLMSSLKYRKKRNSWAVIKRIKKQISYRIKIFLSDNYLSLESVLKLYLTVF
jgi:hypothetical protein